MVHNPHRRARLQATIGAVIATGLAVWTRGAAFIGIAGAAVLFCLLAWVAPPAHAPIQRAIDRLSRGVVWLASWVTLGFVYFCIFMPVRFIAVAFGRDPLDLKHRSPAMSHFKSLPAASPRRFERQF